MYRDWTFEKDRGWVSKDLGIGYVKKQGLVIEKTGVGYLEVLEMDI